MKASILTKRDPEVGNGVFNSIRWAAEAHVKDPKFMWEKYETAILHGNGDCPDRIDFFRKPLDKLSVNSKPTFVWKPAAE